MVRRLNRSVKIDTPSSFAFAYLKTYFLECGPQANGAELELRFPLPRFLIDGLTLTKRVTVRLSYSGGGTEARSLHLSWQPLGSGPLPAFDGTLTTVAQTETTCALVLAGTYAPPGGIAGIVFDQIIGVRIATATVNALLERFHNRIEADYAVRLAL